MPPATPRTTRSGRRRDGRTVRGGLGDGAGGGLALGVVGSRSSRPSLISRRAIDSGFSCTCGLDQRADVLEQALAELGVVGVDLAGALGGVDHQRVLRVGGLEQVVDRAGW